MSRTGPPDPTKTAELSVKGTAVRCQLEAGVGQSRAEESRRDVG